MKDLRALLEDLEARGEVAHVTREVSPEYELQSVAKAIHEKTGKAVLFEHVKGSEYPVVSYALNSRETVCRALQMKPEKMAQQWSEREAGHGTVVRVENAPVQEVVETEVDLEKLPLCLHCDGNNGRYITGGVLIARHPVHGDLNASFNRCQLAGKDKLRVRMMPPQHLGQFHHAAEELGQPLPLAIVIGASPAVMFSAASKIPFGRDELEFAGTLGREDVEVVKCKTIDVDVPANAELVIEGYVLPDVREEEGPFGEFTDSYVPVMKNHVFHATCVTHRKGAFWHDIWAGGKEDIKLLGLPIESEIYNHISKFANPDDILDIVAAPFVFGCFIRLKKRSEEQPRNVMLSALASYAWTQFVVVVDEDVNVYDPNDVLWAIQTRCCPERDIMLIPGVSSYTREDVKEENRGKFAIDATAPLSKAFTYRRRTNKFDGTYNLNDYYKV